MSDPAADCNDTVSGLKKIPPYWYSYTTMAKLRWIGRQLLEVVSTEFRDRSLEYYKYALESGVTTINGKIALPSTIIKNGDRIENIVHRHEPPVTSKPIRIILHDVERQFLVVDKPGSIPVHASGRYNRNTLVEILKDDFGFEKVYTVNRLDRLTSGLLIIPLSADCARQLTSEFMAGTVRKEYVARCVGEFPPQEITCAEPLLTVDRQMGLNIVHPKGKPAVTTFERIRYDSYTNSSIVRCRPLTGRSHQIRVHLQYIGHPIANDPVYSDINVWGKTLGKGGMEINPCDERSAPAPPHFPLPNIIKGNPESLERDVDDTSQNLLPRETGEDIGLGSPVPLSRVIVDVITKLRTMKDKDEDWSRWRDVAFRAKRALTPRDLQVELSLSEKIRFNQVKFKDGSLDQKMDTVTNDSTCCPRSVHLSVEGFHQNSSVKHLMEEPEKLYCRECYLPLHPDPKPERLYIFLHALKYTTSLGSFQTEMPDWVAKGWTWDKISPSTSSK